MPRQAEASFFDEFKARGFTNVRVPVQWAHHTATAPPYQVCHSRASVDMPAAPL